MQYCCNNLSKWKKNSAAIIKAASDKLYGPMLTLPSGKRTKSPVAEMESILIAKLKEHRMKARKVSCRWICINAIKIQHNLDIKNKTNLCKWFKASRGWFHRFLRRNHIKFRKRKSGKKNSTDQNIEKLLNFYSYMWYQVLPKRQDENLMQYTDKWGRYPPHLRYNMDQVPLPFVVDQETTYTLDCDDDVPIAGHGKGDLQKRQFTMNIYINVGVGEH